MTISKLDDIKLLSRTEILDQINQNQSELIFLYSQNKMNLTKNFKNHRIKFTKRYLRQLKTFLTYQDKLLKT